MMTLSGQLITLEDGNPTLSDMAIGLSRIPRFVGQTIYTSWSVAHHSLVVEAIVAEMLGNLRRGDLETTMYALFHDAHEMMTGDIPTTFKTPDMKRLQQQLDRRLFASLGVTLPSEDQVWLIKTADHEALLAEARVVTPPETYERICFERRGEAFDLYVNIVRDILGLEDVASIFHAHAERALVLWGRKAVAA